MADLPKLRGVISRQSTVWCGDCDRWEQVDGAGVAEFRQTGWRYTTARGWLCRPCQRKRRTALGKDG